MVFRNKLNKKGIELHINTLVIVILSLFILILSFVLYRTVISKSMEMSDQLNDQIKKRIEQIILESEDILNPIAIPFNFVVLKGKGVANFGYALINEKEDCTNFRVFVSYVNAYDFEKNFISAGDQYVKIDPKYVSGYELDVKKNERIFKNIAISFLGNKKGVYIFQVNVSKSCDNSLYGYPTYIFIVAK
ncbi:MAG: hypothetical protein QXR30_00075 [Candidatus Woesearchaeota archaeon]